MEDDSESCRSMDITSLLYCHEDPLVSTPPPASPAAAVAPRGDDPAAADGINVLFQSSSLAAAVIGDQQEELLMDYMARQRCYAPTRGYLDHLLTQQQQQGSSSSPSISHGVSSARSRGVQYIIYAFGRLGLAAATAFNAVNYLDRFLSINCHLRWEVWMVELVSVACLSIACKLDEVNIPSLHDLQMEEAMSNTFRPPSIRDMELTLLKALQWRIACVTPYSFLQLLLPLITCSTSAASRCTRLLIRSLSEPSLLRFDSSVIAASALRSVALQDHHQAHVSCHISHLICRECALDKDAVNECFEMMKTLHTSLDLNNNHLMYSRDQQWSPISVIPFQTDGTVNRSAVTRRLFGRLMPDGTENGDSTSSHTQRDEVISHK
ncbi:putative cyclin-D7-1 [Phragmites australis]|uniref:putative cyclin-D7-1 n=1 Tax=Phragmites australis TaxID=29695 RepID=UPI002D77B28B|nr:putative cyclin-D7-1 [Phragmites australis]